MSSRGAVSVVLPRLTTARLDLRPTELDDFEAYAALAADPLAARFLGGPQARSVAWRGFMTMAGAWFLQGFSMFSVVLRDSGEWIGRIGPWMPADWPGPEVGWGIAPRYWGRGYATEAAAASISWAFDTLGWSEVIHSIHPDNAASIALAERLGSRYRGPGRLPEPHDTLEIGIWAQTREEWRRRTSGGGP